MRCVVKSCRSKNIVPKRKFDQDSETRMVKYKGINCNKRHYKCLDCGAYFPSLELPEEVTDKFIHLIKPDLDSKI